MAAGALDDSGRDWPTVGERGRIVEVGGFVGEVGSGFVGGLAPRRVEVGVGGLAADRGGDLAGLGFEHPGRLAVDPLRGRLIIVGVKTASGVPQVSQDVHEVDDDRDLDLPFASLELDPLDLMVGAVDQRDPGAAVLGVAPLGLVEDPLDDLSGGVDNAGGQPLVLGDWPRLGLIALRRRRCEDVGRGARRRLGVLDSADLRHPLAVLLLLPREPGLGRGARAGPGRSAGA